MKVKYNLHILQSATYSNNKAKKNNFKNSKTLTTKTGLVVPLEKGQSSGRVNIGPVNKFLLTLDVYIVLLFSKVKDCHVFYGFKQEILQIFAT